MPTHHMKNLLIDLVIGLLLFANWKGDSYESIYVIVNCLTKIVHYKQVKLTISAPRLAEIITNVVVQYHGLPDSIVISDHGAIFTFKF